MDGWMDGGMDGCQRDKQQCLKEKKLEISCESVDKKAGCCKCVSFLEDAIF